MRKNHTKILSGIVSSTLSGEKQGDFFSRDIKLDNEKFTYQLYVPPNLKSENLPLMIFLHGIRERGNGGYISGIYSTIIKQYLKEIPAMIMFPQCRPDVYWSDQKMDRMVTRQIESIKNEFSVNEHQNYLIGVSMGGYGVWSFASKYPDKFAALVSICGGSPLKDGDRFSPIARKIGKTPAWLFHGSEDNVVQVSESRNMAAAIRENGGNVKYSEYAGVGHNVYINAIGEKELMPWILSQKLGS